MTASFIAGAEAVIESTEFLGEAVLAKRRIPKAYRHPQLDDALRNARTRDEANLLFAARHAGVPVPIVFDVDRAAATLLLEHIPGNALKEVLATDDDATARSRLRRLGALVALLHDAGITHGDLTTSNLLVPDATDPKSLVIIDFGLGQATQEVEPKAVDLHLIEEALEATDARAAAMVAAFLDGYAGAGGTEAVLRRLEAVRERGRYRGAA